MFEWQASTPFRWQVVRRSWLLPMRVMVELRDEDMGCWMTQVTYRDGTIFRTLWRDAALGGGYGHSEAELLASIARRKQSAR